jgi:hypothetical protein
MRSLLSNVTSTYTRLSSAVLMNEPNHNKTGTKYLYFVPVHNTLRAPLER